MGPRDLERFPRDKRRVFSLALEIYSRVNSIKRSKRIVGDVRVSFGGI